MTAGETRGPGWFRRHRGLKALSVLLAAATWYWIRDTISYETLVSEVPIDLLCDPGMAVLDRSEATADLRFRGARGDVIPLTREQVTVVIDARGQKPGAAIVLPLRARDVQSPRGARVVSVWPKAIRFRLDPEGERLVPVKAEVQGAPPPGFEVESLACEPAAVRVHGPSTRLQALESVRTEPIDLEGRLQTFRVRRSVTAPDPAWSARTVPDRVAVEVRIAERAASRTFEQVPVLVLLAPPGARPVRTEPASVRLVLEGRQEALAALSAGQVSVYADGSQLEGPGRYDLPVAVHLPPGLRTRAVEPATVRLMLEEAPREAIR